MNAPQLPRCASLIQRLPIRCSRALSRLSLLLPQALVRDRQPPQLLLLPPLQQTRR